MKGFSGLHVALLGVLLLLIGVLLGPQQRTEEVRGAQRQSIGGFSSLTVPTPTPTPVLYPPLLQTEQGIKVPVLLYHYISESPNKDDKTRNGLSTPPTIFAQQLQLLADHGYTTITFDELAAIFAGKMTAPPKPVILTFDDGYEDFYLNAYPLLKKYSMKGVAFIPTGLIGGQNYLTWTQIEDMAKSPNVVFGAHSVHHYSLPPTNARILQEEVEGSKRTLEQHVGYRVNWFAYPYGTFDHRVLDEVKHAGFIGAITTIPGNRQYQSRFYYIPRLRAGKKTGKDFLALIS